MKKIEHSLVERYFKDTKNSEDYIDYVYGDYAVYNRDLFELWFKDFVKDNTRFAFYVNRLKNNTTTNYLELASSAKENVSAHILSRSRKSIIIPTNENIHSLEEMSNNDNTHFLVNGYFNRDTNNLMTKLLFNNSFTVGVIGNSVSSLTKEALHYYRTMKELLLNSGVDITEVDKNIGSRKVYILNRN